MRTILEEALSILKSGEPLVLATIISHEGSTPRDTGTRFIIRRDGTIFGTIGGGLVELQVCNAAVAVFETGRPAIIDYDMSASHLKPDAMICGGKMATLLERFEPAEHHLAFFKSLQKVYLDRSEALLVINIGSVGEDGGRTSHAVVAGNETLFSSLSQTLDAPLFSAEIGSEIRGSRAVRRRIGEAECWIESLQFPKKLILFGAGHVARPTADLGSRVGFQTIVVDDRESVVSRDYFPEPVELIQIDDFAKNLDRVQVDRDSFVVILTRGHQYDKIVLARILTTDAPYIGMIGSRRKRNTIYQLLLDEGFSQADLGRVHCPVGLDIGADTPEEISVSIVAELIKVRAALK